MTIEQLLERKDVKQQILESLKKTKETRREHVFNFCTIYGDINITDIEEGKRHNVGAKNKCSVEGAKVIGAFHTHTRLTKGDIIPSPRDVLKSVEEDLDFFCTGINKDNMRIVRCFDKNGLLLEIDKVLEETKKDITGENIQRASRHMVGRMITDKDYLNKHSYVTQM